MKKITLRAWFKQQFGALPMAPNQRDDLVKRRRQIEHEMYAIDSTLAQDTMLRDQYQAASYVWTIKDNQKGKLA